MGGEERGVYVDKVNVFEAFGHDDVDALDQPDARLARRTVARIRRVSQARTRRFLRSAPALVYRRGCQEHERKLKSIETLAVDP